MILLLTVLLACDAEPDPCDGAPVVTWDSFGKGFVRQHCQSCHARSSAARHGAPLDVAFDTPEDVARHAEAMLSVSTGPAPRMPPQGGVSEDDRERLRTWLTCDLP